MEWPQIDELDSIVEAFESARLIDGVASVVTFLPPSSHPRYWEIAAELVRVDMELSSNDGTLRGLDSYCDLIPGLSSNAGALEQVAYEEYRLRAARGEQVAPEEYSSRYQISTTNWKRLARSTDKPTGPAAHTLISRSLPSAWSDALELADEIAEFPESGTEFAGFHLEREIGRGAFAKVYLARQGQLADRYVVLKVAAGKSLEPQHLARMQHTHIVPIYSVHQVGRLTAVCMPYLGSRTLADFVRGWESQAAVPKTGQAFLSTVRAHADETCVAIELASTELAEKEPLPTSIPDRVQLARLSEMSYVEAVTRIVLQIAEGLMHAHQRGIVHRDLKLANILLTDDGNALILDFNLSTEIVVNGPAALAVGGTLPYMAPEHLEALLTGRPVDFRSDIYSLGVMFFELLSGKQPFPIRKGSLETVVEQMLEDRRTSIPANELGATASPDIAAIITRCLAPRLEDRYQSIEQLHEDLTRHLSDLPLQHAANTSLLLRFQKWSRRHPRLTSAGGVSALAGALLLAGTWVTLRLAAENSYQRFTAELPAARAALSIAEDDAGLLGDGMSEASAMLASYGVSSEAQWHRPLASRLLNTEQASALKYGLSELSFQMADAHARLAKLNDDPDFVRTATAWNELASSLVPPDKAPLEYANQRAELLETRGDLAAAQEIRRFHANLDQSGPLDEFLAARQLVFSGKYAQAIPELLALRNKNPQDPVIWLLLGDAYAGKGELARADECFSTAIALLPQSYIALYNRGRCRADMRQFELAVDDYTAALKLKPQFPACLLNRALAHAVAGNHPAAVEDFSTALERGAPYTRIYFLRARSYDSLGNTAAAAKDRETGLSLQPRDEESWIARGIARLDADPHGALADFQEALAINPQSISALQNVVHVNADILRQNEDALETLDAILEINPTNADALAGRAVLFARQGKAAEAAADLEILLHVSGQPKHLFQAACAHSIMSATQPTEGQQALQLLARAIALDPRLAQRAETDPDLEKTRELEGFAGLRISATPQAVEAPQE